MRKGATSRVSFARSMPRDTWGSTKPGKATMPGWSMTSASQGIWTSPWGPTAVMRPPSITMTPFSMGSPARVMTLPALTAVLET